MTAPARFVCTVAFARVAGLAAARAELGNGHPANDDSSVWGVQKE